MLDKIRSVASHGLFLNNSEKLSQILRSSTDMPCMYLALLSLLAYTAPIVLAAKECETARVKFPSTLIQGQRSGNDQARDPVIFTIPALNRSEHYVYSFYGHRNTTKITRIELLDQNNDGNGGWLKISQGGIGRSFIEIRFVSKPMYGINFIINIYLINGAADFCGVPSVSRMRLGHSRYDLILGNEIPGSKLLSPVMIDSVYPEYEFYGNTHTKITRIELLDQTGRGGKPKIIYGGVGNSCKGQFYQTGGIRNQFLSQDLRTWQQKRCSRGWI